MKKKNLLFLLTFILLTTINAIAQTTWYVNDNSMTGDKFTSAVGSDANNGTSAATPKATVEAAAALAQSGDRIMVDNGTYFVQGFTVPAGVKIVGANPQTTILRVQPSGPIVLSSNSEIWNCQLYRKLPEADGGAPTITLSNVSGSQNVRIENCYFYKNRTAIYLGWSTNTIISRNKFEDNRTGIIVDVVNNTNHDNLIIRDNEIKNSRSFGILFFGPADGTHTGYVKAKLENNIITGNLAANVEVNNNNSNSDILFRNNKFDNYPPDIYPSRTNGLFNVADHNGAGLDNPSFTWNGSGADPGFPNDISGAGDYDTMTNAATNPMGAGPTLFVKSTNPSFDYYTNIQDAINSSNNGATITAQDGTYREDVTINKTIALKGTSQEGTIIKGLYYGAGSTVAINATNASVNYLTVTRDYGATLGEWQSATNKKTNAGIELNANGDTVNNVTITGNRNGLYINNRQGYVVKNNRIVANRTGIQIGNNISNGTITNNIIDSNFTHGLMINTDLSGTQIANNTNIKNNQIKDNWYTNLYINGANALTANGAIFSCNYFGTNAPAKNAVSAGESGYATQVPAQFGGNGTGLFVADIAGSKVALVSTAPWLVNGVDVDAAASGYQRATSLTVIPSEGTPSISNNDYSLLAGALGCAESGNVVTLSGTFNWNTPEAKAAWALGNNGIADAEPSAALHGIGDDYSITIPDTVTNVTLTAIPGNAVIKGPGDIADVSLENVIFFDSRTSLSNHKNWTISNIEFDSFDVAVIADHNGGPVNVMDGFTFTNNTIRVPVDLNTSVAPNDNFQNIGLHLNYGKNQTITNNKFYLDVSGVSSGSNSSSTNAIQSATSGGNVYDGLKINNNEFYATGVPNTNPPKVVGIWENGNNQSAAIEIKENKFTNVDAGNTHDKNNQLAFRTTSYSGDASHQVVYKNNEVTGWNRAFDFIGDPYSGYGVNPYNSGTNPVLFTNNKIDDVNFGITVRKKAGSANAGAPAIITNNSFTNVDSYAVGYVGESGVVDANCNWWGTTSLNSIDSLISITQSGSVNRGTILNNGGNSAATGFEPTGDCEGIVQNLTQNSTYPTIQAAIDAAQSNDTIYVPSGVYNESVTINKSVILWGAQHGVDPRPIASSIRAIGSNQETIIKAAGSTRVFNLTANDINIDGFQLQHINPITYGEDVISNVPGIAGIEITNNIIYKANDEGIQLKGANDVLIKHNYIFQATGDGINLSANPNGSNQKIYDNEIDSSASTYGSIYLYAVKDVDIKGNYIHGYNNGIAIGEGGDANNFAKDIKVHNNDIRIEFYHYLATLYGVAIANNNSANILIDSNNIITNTNDATGVKHLAIIRINNNPSNVTINSNYLERPQDSAYIFVANTVTNQVNATCNWLGSETYADLSSRISGNGAIDYVPFLKSGTDEDGNTIGFTPQSDACSAPVENLTTGNFYATIQEAVNTASPNDSLQAYAGVFNERVVIDKPLTLLGVDSATTILDGTGLSGTGSGIKINSNITDVTIKNLAIRNYAGNGSNTDAGIKGGNGNNNLLVENVAISNINNASGFFASGPVDSVTVTGSSFINQNGPNARGIVIWDNLKKNITITNNVVVNNNCCGIEMQDGAATGVLIQGNTITAMDNGIGLIGLTTGSGQNKANIISDNQIVVNGRFGIEVKNPNGTGNDNEQEDGAIIVKNNNVSLGTTARTEDLAGIAVYRRGVTAMNVDIPTGVVVKENIVTGFIQPSASTGFGIVVEGTNHKVLNNTVTGNDVAVQVQAGHLPYPNDGDQSNVADAYFGRGNSPVSCNIHVEDNGADATYVGVDATQGYVLNSRNNKLFCSIQTAIDDNETQNGDTILLNNGTYNEQVKINKALTIKNTPGADAVIDYTGTVSGKPTLFDISVDNVTIDSLHFKVNLSKLSSAIIASGAAIDTVIFKNNFIEPYGTASFGVYSNRNAVSVNYGGNISYRNATDGVAKIVFDNNKVTANGTASFRAGICADEAGGTFTNNDLQTINQDVLVRFANNGSITITGNQFKGGGAEVSDHNAQAGLITISDNTFDGTFVSVKPIANPMLRLKQNNNQTPTLVSNNTFTNIRWGISLENYNADTIRDNTFTPDATVTDFSHITVNTKLLASTPISDIARKAISADIRNNTFNGSDNAGTSKAIAFYNHWNNGGAQFGTFTVAGNTFKSGIKNYVYFDTLNNILTSNPIVTGSYPEYPDNGDKITTTGYWTKDIKDSNNLYGVGAANELAYSEMNFSQRFDSLYSHIYDKVDNTNLGRYIFNMPVHNLTHPADYASIQEAIDAAQVGDTILADAGVYNERINISKNNLVIKGANASIDGNSNTRGDETVLTAPTGQLTQTLIGLPTGITATMDGFTVAGTEQVVANTAGNNAFTFKNNIIRNVTSSQNGSGHNFYWAGGTLVIDSNKVVFNGQGTDNNGGKSHFFIGGGTMEATGNTFSSSALVSPTTGTTSRPVLFNLTSNLNQASIHDNIFDDFGLGMLIADHASNLDIYNNNFSNAVELSSPTYGAAIAFYGGFAPTGLINIHNNNFTNSSNGIRTSGGATTFPGSNLLQIRHNKFSGITNSAIRVGAAFSGTLDALCNSFGEAAPFAPSIDTPGNAVIILSGSTAKVNYKNWLVYGDNNESVLGFQTQNAYTVSSTGNINANNNDYRILSNAIGCAQKGDVVTLSGSFDWSNTTAIADWKNGNDGIAGNADDWAIVLPNNIDSVTLTGTNTATINGPGDLPEANLEAFIAAYSGHNAKWDINSLIIKDIDAAILFDNTTSAASTGLKIHDNTIYIPKDLNTAQSVTDANQNIGIDLANGIGQEIYNNTFVVDGSGITNSPTQKSTSVVLQSTTTGGTMYDGLKIYDNTIHVTGTPNADTAKAAYIIGLWENSHNKNADIQLYNNKFLNDDAGNLATNNKQMAFRVTSRSGADKQVTYNHNEITGWNRGIEWIGDPFGTNGMPAYEADATPVKVENNKFDNVGYGVSVRKAAGQPNTAAPAVIHDNSFTNIDRLAISYSGGGDGTVDASCNYYDTTDMSGLISGDVNYWSHLTDGTNTASIGFEPAADVACEGRVLNVTKNVWYNSIQEAIDAANTTNGDSLWVTPGIYKENVLVNKQVKINGSGQDSTIIYPALSSPNCASPGSSTCGTESTIMRVQASNVAITNVTLDGDNPALTSGVIRNGADIDARNGVLILAANGSDAYSNVEVGNVNVKNIYLRGIQASNTANINIYNDSVTNVAGDPNYSVSIFNRIGSGKISNNYVGQSYDAVNANFSNGTIFEGNTIVDASSGIHSDNSGGNGGGVPDTIRNNTVMSGKENSFGIWLFAPYKAVQIYNNKIDSNLVGLAVYGQYAAITPLFKNNEVDGKGIAGSYGAYVSTQIPGYDSTNVSADLENNIFTGIDTALYFESQLNRTNTTIAHNNYINGASQPTAMAISSGNLGAGSYALDLNCNWWGSTDVNDISDLVSDNITVNSWLDNGTDEDANVIGFQTNAACSGRVHNVTQDTWYSTIQNAVSAASTTSADVIVANAGVYAENVVIDRAVDLRGNNYGINPNTDARNPESIIVPASNDTTGGSIIYLNNTASSSSINGFTLDGDNPDIDEGSNINGADGNASEAISAYDGIANVIIKDNIIRSLAYGGIDLYNYNNGGSSTTGNEIAENRISNITQGAFGLGVIIYNNAYTHIHHNVFDSVRVGIQTGNFYQADNGNSHSINDNIMLNVSRRGIFHNLHYSNASSFDIVNNAISGVANTNNDGIMLSSIQQTVGANVSNNTIADVRNGYNLWNNPTSDTITITGGSVSNTVKGIFANNYAGYNSNANTSIYTIDGVNIQNASQAGIYIQDSTANTDNATVTVGVKNNTQLQNNTKGIVLEGADAKLYFDGTLPATFAGQAWYIDQITNGADVPNTDIDASEAAFDIPAPNSVANNQSYDDIQALEAKVHDKDDSTILGQIIFKRPVINTNTLATYPTIQSAVDAASPNDSLFASKWIYKEDVNINKEGIKLSGVLNGTDTSEVIGLISTNPTILITANNVSVSNLMVTRDGNNPAHFLNHPKTQGIAFNSRTGTHLFNLYVHGNRTGIDMNNSPNTTIEFSDIDFNRTGIMVNNVCDGSIIRNNNITNNWTEGVLMNISSAGVTNNLVVRHNKIAGNWYANVENRFAGTLLDFTGNSWNTDSVWATASPAGEASYNAVWPTEYGGSGMPTAAQEYFISGATDRVDYTAWLPNNVTNNQVAGAPGFIPDTNYVYADEASPTLPGMTKLNRAERMVAEGGTIHLMSPDINSSLATAKALTIAGNAGTHIINGLTYSGAGKQLHLSTPITIDNAFDLQAGVIKVESGGGLAVDMASATLAVTESNDNYVDGAMSVLNASNDVLFPVGKDGKGNYAKLHHESGTGSFTAEYFPVAYSDLTTESSLNSVSNKEYWDIAKTTGDYAGKVELYSRDEAFSGITNAAVIAHYNGTGWKSFGQSANDVNPLRITANEVAATFSPFTFGTGNGLPVAVDDDYYETEEDVSLVITPLSNDTDPDGDALTITSINGTALSGANQDITVDNGIVQISGSTLTFVPAENWNGTTTFPYTITDGNEGSVSANITILVNAINDAPIAVNDTFTTNEDVAVALSLLTNDSDPDGTTPTLQSINGTQVTGGVQSITVTNGTVEIASGGGITFVPAANYNGSTTFPYVITDGSATATANININITAVNDAPVAQNDTYTTNEDVTVALSPLTNDSDPDGTTPTLQSINGTTLTGGVQSITVTNGTIQIASGGGITFVPAANYNGSATFPYVITDGTLTATANININITAVNDAPIAVNDAYTTNEDIAVTITPLANDTDPENDALIISSINGTAVSGNPTITINGTGGEPIGSVTVSGTTYTFTPASNYNGAVTFPYSISDGNGGTATATININVTPLNDAPVAVNDAYTTNEDVSVALSPLTNDSDPDGTTPTLQSINGTTVTGGVQSITVTNGTVEIASGGSIAFVPTANYNGSTTFPYVITDGTLIATANININITAVNDAPLAVNDAYTTNEDVAVALSPLTNDSDPDGTTPTLQSINGTTVTGGVQTISVTNGTVQIASGGGITFVPAANYNGSSTFPYVITDGSLIATANININITAVNDAPIAVNDTFTTNEDVTVALSPLTNDSDPDGTTPTLQSINGTAVTGSVQSITVTNGTVEIASGGSITFVPAANYNGSATFPYVITDGTLTATANINISITAVNDAPVAQNDNYTTNEDVSVALSPLTNDSDPDGTTPTLQSINGTAVTGGVQNISVTNGTVQIASGGGITFVPAANYNGSTTFPYVITDGTLTATANININITAVNDAPVAVNDAYTTNEDVTVALSPLSNDSDPDGTTPTLQSINGTQVTGGVQSITVTNGTVEIASGGGITFVPAANYNGSSTFPYVITDGTLIATANINISITAVNDAPVAADDNYTTEENVAVVLTPLANDTDPDGDALKVSSINGTALTGSNQNITVTNGTVQVTVAGADTTIQFTPATGFYGNVTFPYTVDDGNGGTATANQIINVTRDTIMLAMKVYLQGAYNTTLQRHKDVTPAWSNVLKTNASSQPYNTPAFGNYNCGESVNPNIFASTAGVNDIVDWVLVELKDGANNLVARRAALVLENGNVVDTDGVSAVKFEVAKGSYVVNIKHRNHLPVRSAVAIDFTTGNATYDFTTAQSAAYQNPAVTTNAAMAATGSKFAMWGGNGANATSAAMNTARATGPNAVNDMVTILAALNGNTIISSVYSSGDYNLDGTIRATGPNAVNDLVILLNALSGETIINAHQ